jgi:hypothetical protein
MDRQGDLGELQKQCYQRYAHHLINMVLPHSSQTK